MSTKDTENPTLSPAEAAAFAGRAKRLLEALCELHDEALAYETFHPIATDATDAISTAIDALRDAATCFWLHIPADPEPFQQTSLEAAMSAPLPPAEHSPELLAGLKWAIARMRGDSGTGETYWSEFPEYKAAVAALEKAEGRK